MTWGSGCSLRLICLLAESTSVHRALQKWGKASSLDMLTFDFNFFFCHQQMKELSYLFFFFFKLLNIISR